MPRPQKFSIDDILDAARDGITVHGKAVTIAQISQHSAIPVGSIYHRFASREELLATLWMRSIRRLHTALFAAADAADDPNEALLAVALTIPRYCREHQAEALAMTLFRQQRLLDQGPATLRPDVASLNDPVAALMGRLCAARYPHVTPERVTLTNTAVIELPYGLVRPHVGQDVPVTLDQVIHAASNAVLALGDQ